jgi:phenylacetate-CoA ligase
MMSWLTERVFYPLNERREGTSVLRSLRLLRASQYAAPDYLADLRWGKLQALLQHAFQNVPFYRRRFQDAGIAPADIRSFEDLRRLPPLTKDDIAGGLESLIATNIPRSAMRRAASGGSTGRHTPFWRDNACLNVKQAAQLRFDSWTGWQVGDKVACVWPAIQDFCGPETLKQRLRRWTVDRTLMLNAGRLDEAALAAHADALGRYRPRLIRAFPNPLSVLARFLRDEPRRRIRPAAVLTAGEPLLLSQRRLFEEVFGCPVFDCYSSRECGQHACECEAHDGLHVNGECLHLEFEAQGQPVEPGRPGHILITDFENYGMPFIRYRIEDVGVPLAGSCPCGRNLPRMAMGAGRVSDFLFSPCDGSLVSGASLCHHLLAQGPDVGQLQIVQDARDHLTIRVRRRSGSAAALAENAYIEDTIARIFHGAMRVTIQPVESIPHEKSGKYRFCINRLPASGAAVEVAT